jgi:hypothetical protein
MNLAASLLVLDGLIVLLIGFWCGQPLRRAINAGASEQQVAAWRVAHSSLVSGGVMLLAIAAVLGQLSLSRSWQMAVAILMSISLYAFSYALTVGARTGHRGLVPQGAKPARRLYLANVMGAILSTGGLGILMVGAALSVAKGLAE